MNDELVRYILDCCLFGDFTLTSGKKSDFYFDVKSLMFSPRQINLLGRELFFTIEKEFGDVDCVGGMELGSIPLTTAISIHSVISGVMYNPVHHFAIRKKPRKHGTKSQIEGKCGGDIILVDDVLTTGGSLVKAQEVLTKEGHKVHGAIVVVDREEKTKKFGFPVVSLFTKSQIKKINEQENIYI